MKSRSVKHKGNESGTIHKKWQWRVVNKKKRESICSIVQSQSYKQKPVMRYVLWAFHCLIWRFVLVGIVWVQEALIALRQKQIHAFMALALIWIHAFLLHCPRAKAGYVMRYLVSFYWGPMKAISACVWGSREAWKAFIQQICHFNHQKSRPVYVDSFINLQIETWQKECKCMRVHTCCTHYQVHHCTHRNIVLLDPCVFHYLNCIIYIFCS